MMKQTGWICGLLALLLCVMGIFPIAMAEGKDEVDGLIEWWKLDREALGQSWELDPEAFGSAPEDDEIQMEPALRLAVEAILEHSDHTISDLENHHLNFSFVDNDGTYVSPVASNQRAWYFIITNKDLDNRSERGFFVVVDGPTGQVTNLLSRGNDTTRPLM